ncbi:Transcriptional regulator, MarR family [uncultured Eubacteriales bacterium]|uniref:Transcriptional regulator, MarR family n=1 Tax=uncultured Eubacteriales bacterium TaxID=172733 RepID=A0A212K8W3_9FIRM|nr:Transcriptional regulator, MarR family [uncultured Eubacteriales bacterium]
MKKSAVREQLYRLEVDRRRRLQPLFAHLNLAPGQPRILNYLLEQGGGLTQRELADACYLDATTLSRALDRLEERGLVSRSTNGANRRANLITLTPEGEELAQEVAQGFRRMDEGLWQGFAPEEMEALMDGMERLRKNLDRLED